MSGEDRVRPEHDCGGDAAAYVLGALEPGEADAFARHMATCIVCRDEVVALEQVVSTLPMSAPQYAAPKRLRGRIMRDVRADLRANRPAVSAARRRWQPRPGRVPFALAGAGGLAAVAVAIVIALGASPSSRTISASLGDASIRLSGGHAELIARDLPAPAAGHVYEVWLRRGRGAPQPTSTLFSPTAGGTSDVGLAGSMHGIDEVMVTQERAGGSQVPTTPPVIDVHLT